MPDTQQITCVNKSDRYNPHERILFIGGANTDGTPWKISQTSAIDGVLNGTWRFFVRVNGKSVWVIVAETQDGHKYLKTENDGKQPNNLLSLPECP
jgi:hypothetical protein